MKDLAGIGIVVAILCLGAWVGGMVGSFMSWKDGESRWKTDVVKHGCGEFAITDTLKGTTEFKWRTP